MVDENEALTITGKDTVEDAADVLSREGLKTIAIKRGEKGALVKDDKEKVEIPAVPPQQFVDSIGAGNAFDAAFLQGMLEGKDIREAARMGISAATMSIEGVGGSETFPTGRSWLSDPPEDTKTLPRPLQVGAVCVAWLPFSSTRCHPLRLTWKDLPLPIGEIGIGEVVMQLYAELSSVYRVVVGSVSHST